MEEMYKHTSRPARSDAHLSPEEEAEKEEETREYFQELAPKRHTKPSRSEYSSIYSDDLKFDNQRSIPEFERLQNLEADSQKLECDGNEAIDDYVETKYYKDLNGVDKEHHMTGSGFIKMEKSCDGSFLLNSEAISVGSDCHPSTKGNPATNEWIPSADPMIPISDKPSRSDA